MKLWVGTSGWSYKEWKGTFYPDDMSNDKMLAYYSERLTSVEVNNTFYRMPKREVVEGWSAQTPAGFSFVLKASRRITHQAKLGPEAAGPLAYLLESSEALGEKRGPILFQTPPWLKKDMETLGAFLELVPPQVKAAFEFRSTSWFDDDVYDCLRSHGAALVVADTGNDEKDPPLVATAPFGYARLRREEYQEGLLEDWARRLADAGWNELWAFFKHEDGGTGPRLATRFRELVI